MPLSVLAMQKASFYLEEAMDSHIHDPLEVSSAQSCSTPDSEACKLLKRLHLSAAQRLPCPLQDASQDL